MGMDYHWDEATQRKVNHSCIFWLLHRSLVQSKRETSEKIQQFQQGWAVAALPNTPTGTAGGFQTSVTDKSPTWPVSDSFRSRTGEPPSPLHHSIRLSWHNTKQLMADERWTVSSSVLMEEWRRRTSESVEFQVFVAWGESKCWTHTWEANVATADWRQWKHRFAFVPHRRLKTIMSPHLLHWWEEYTSILHTPHPHPLIFKSLTHVSVPRLSSLLAVLPSGRGQGAVVIPKSVHKLSFNFFFSLINILPHSYFMHFTALLLHWSDYWGAVVVKRREKQSNNYLKPCLTAVQWGRWPLSAPLLPPPSPPDYCLWMSSLRMIL